MAAPNNVQVGPLEQSLADFKILDFQAYNRKLNKIASQ